MPGPPGPAAPIPARDDAVAAGAALAGLDGAQPVPAAEAPEEVPGVEAVPPPGPEPEPAPPPAPPPAPDGVPGPMAAAPTLDLDWGPPPEADDPGEQAEQVEHVEQSEQSEQSEQAEPAEQEQPAAKRKDDLYLPEWAEEDHYHLVIEPGDEDS